MSDTPETDTFMTRIRGIDGDKHWVPADTSRRLERERDKARQDAQNYYLKIVELQQKLKEYDKEPTPFPWEKEAQNE